MPLHCFYIDIVETFLARFPHGYRPESTAKGNVHKDKKPRPLTGACLELFMTCDGKLFPTLARYCTHGTCFGFFNKGPQV